MGGLGGAVFGSMPLRQLNYRKGENKEGSTPRKPMSHPIRINKTNSLALIVMRSDSSSFSPVMGSVPLSVMYFKMRRRSYTWPDFVITGSWGGSPDIVQKNMVKCE